MPSAELTEAPISFRGRSTVAGAWLDVPLPMEGILSTSIGEQSVGKQRPLLSANKADDGATQRIIGYFIYITSAAGLRPHRRGALRPLLCRGQPRLSP